MPPSTGQPEAGVVAVLDKKGEAVGMGILVDRHHVLTCAHVVNAALAVDDTVQAKPSRPISMIFPFSRTEKQSKPTRANVMERGWYPVRLPKTKLPDIHDVAVLALAEEAPADIGWARLGSGDPTFKNQFTCYLSVTNDPKGASAQGTIGTRAQDDTYELRATDYIGRFIEPGFSGGGCWDHVKSVTVGMVVTVREDAERVAHMIPARLLRHALEAAAVTLPPPADHDGPRQRLHTEAIRCLKGSRKAVELLLDQLPEAVRTQCHPLPHKDRCERVVAALIGGLVAEAVDAMVLGYISALQAGPESEAAQAIEQLCYCMMPIIYRPDEIRRVRAEVVGNGKLIVLPVTSPTSVEMIMAGVDGRKIEVKTVKNVNDPVQGAHALHRPPEAGMDRNCEKFQADFKKYLARKLLKPEHRRQGDTNLVKSICIELNKQIKFNSRRYYYFYQSPDGAAGRQARSRVVDELKTQFPSIVFFALESVEDGPDESEIVNGLTHLLLKVAEHKESR